MELEYRIVPGFPGYRVGNDGSVWTRVRTGCDWFNEDWRRMSPGIGKWGHHQVRFCRKGEQFRFGVHRLVLELFVGPCPDGYECCHNDGDPRNNRLDNLRWDTVAANKADMNLHGTHNKGSRNGRSKLTEADVLEIRRRSVGESSLALAATFGVSRNTIYEIVLGKTWTHV